MAKEPVTKFDLAAAFKALDDIPVPVPRKGIAPNRPNLSEDMKRVSKTDLLLEDYYDVRSQEDLTKAADERNAEIAKAKLARIEKIVDLNAESPEDLLPTYEGKVIIQCPQCMTLFYKDPEDIEHSENAEEEVVNVGEECQHCGNTDGYNLIGKVAPVADDERDQYEGGDELPAEDEIPDATEDEEPADEENDEAEADNSGEEELEELPVADEAATVEDEGEDVEESVASTTKTQLNEEADKEALTEDDDASLNEFKDLISSSEFKAPISDEEVRGYLGESKTRLNEFVLASLEKQVSAIAQTVIPKSDKLDDYSFVVVPYGNLVSNGKQTNKVDINKIIRDDEAGINVKRFTIDKFKNACALAAQYSLKSDIGVNRVYIFLARKDETSFDKFKQTVAGPYRATKGAGEVPLGQHPCTFAIYEAGKSISPVSIEKRYKTAAAALKQAKDAEGGEDVLDQEETNGDQPSSNGDTPAEQPSTRGDDGSPAPAEETPAEPAGKPDSTDAEENKPKPAARPRATKPAKVFGEADKGKYILVYGSNGSNSLVLNAASAEEAQTLARGKSFGKVKTFLLGADGKKSGFYDGKRLSVDQEDYPYDGTTPVWESFTNGDFEELEDLDEAVFERLIKESLANVYDNITNVAISGCRLTEGKLIVECVLQTDKKKQITASYVFTEAKTNQAKLFIIGSNNRLNESKIMVRGSVSDGKFIAEAIKYKYNMPEYLIEGITGKPKARKLHKKHK